MAYILELVSVGAISNDFLKDVCSPDLALRLFSEEAQKIFWACSENFLGLLGKFSGPPLKTPSYMDFASYIHPPITEITQGATLADELYSHY